jgi:hypothetical protein
MTDQGYSLERRRLLRWLGAAALVLPAALTACASSNASRGWTTSHITGSDHRDGPSQPIRTYGIRYTF